MTFSSALIPGCYRIMEAAIEQACCQPLTQEQPQASTPSLTLQQSRQVLGVLEEAFSALMYHLQQVSFSSPPPTAPLLKTAGEGDLSESLD